MASVACLMIGDVRVCSGALVGTQWSTTVTIGRSNLLAEGTGAALQAADAISHAMTDLRG